MSLTELLAARAGRQTVVVGIGNPHRGDDAAGCLVARNLRDSAQSARFPRLKVVEAEEVPESFLGLIVRPRPDTVILVDAVELGEPPGTAALLEVEDLEDRASSTHSPPLSLVAHYIRAQTGADVFLLGIQPGERGLGTSPSVEVQDAATHLAHVLEEATC
jgi:hydrogenase 3 maturation protease